MVGLNKFARERVKALSKQSKKGAKMSFDIGLPVTTNQGSTESCFKSFIATYPDAEDHKIIAELLGVSYNSTFRPWVLHGLRAKGERLVRVRCMLRLFGYECSEWRNMPDWLQVIVFSLFVNRYTPGELKDLLDYSDTQHFYRIIMQHPFLTDPYRVELAQLLAREVRELVYYKIETFREDPRLLGRNLFKRLKALYKKDKTTDVSDSSQRITANHLDAAGVLDMLIESFETLAGSTLKVARYLVSDQFSSDDRRKMRERIGRGKLSDLNGILDALTSEQNRSKYLELRQKERISH